ncbi:hypothetical protein QBC43DRAFT_359286 [Cladorrhinum sp. PSN259]|nr:hypothetical protein QBC43DRAFT_359286 [Cladorrhinum sp. PSN259]
MDFDISKIPAMPPPPGVTSNFENPETMHAFVSNTAVSTMAFIFVVVAIRIYTKALIMKEMKIEEYFVILATIGIIIWDAMFIHVSSRGFSRHLWDVRAIDAPYLALMNYGGEISHTVVTWTAKCSILFQLERLFCPDHTRNSSYWSIAFLLVLNTTYHIAALIAYIFQCTPREKTWNGLLEGKCINVVVVTVVSGAVNLFLDLGILVIPIVAVCHLPLPMGKKLGISAIFGVGIFTCAIAALGVVFRCLLFRDPDLTWILTKVGIWTMIEYGGTILVSCMLSFPRFYRHLRGQREPERSSSQSPVCKMSAATATPDSLERGNIEYAQTSTAIAPRHLAHKSHNVYGIGIAVSTSEVTLAESGCVQMPQQSHVRPDKYGQIWK